MTTKETIQQEISAAQTWFEIELGAVTEISETLRISICREIVKLSYRNRQLEMALLSLVLAGQVKNPKEFSEADVQNALWLVRDLGVGFDDEAPITKKYYM